MNRQAPATPNDYCCKVVTNHVRCGHTDIQPYYCPTAQVQIEQEARAAQGAKSTADLHAPPPRKCMQYDRYYTVPTLCPECTEKEASGKKKQRVRLGRRGTWDDIVAKGKEAIQGVLRKSDPNPQQTPPSDLSYLTPPQQSPEQQSPSSVYSRSISGNPYPGSYESSPSTDHLTASPFSRPPARHGNYTLVGQDSASLGGSQDNSTSPSANPSHIPITSNDLARLYQSDLGNHPQVQFNTGMTHLNGIWVDDEVLKSYEQWKRAKEASKNDSNM